jgi:hypothetical protein
MYMFASEYVHPQLGISEPRGATASEAKKVKKMYNTKNSGVIHPDALIAG